MITKEELNRLRTIEKRIINKKGEITEAREIAGSPKSINYEVIGGKKQNEVSDPTEKVVEHISELQYELKILMQEYFTLKKKVTVNMEKLAEPMYSVMYFRYINGYDFDKIAQSMHYSNSYIWHLHSKALKYLSKNENLTINNNKKQEIKVEKVV